MVTLSALEDSRSSCLGASRYHGPTVRWRWRSRASIPIAHTEVPTAKVVMGSISCRNVIVVDGSRREAGRTRIPQTKYQVQAYTRPRRRAPVLPPKCPAVMLTFEGLQSS